MRFVFFIPYFTPSNSFGKLELYMNYFFCFPRDRVIVVNMSTEVTHTLMPQRQSIYDSSSNLSSSSTSSGYHSLQHHGSHRLINQSFLEQHHPTPSQSQQPSLSSFPHQLKPSNEPLPAHGFGNHALAVTSLEFLNAHDVGVIMAGYSDSTIRLWRPKETSDENQLLSAWHGLLDFNTSSAAKVSCSEAAPAAHGGLVLAWHQRTQTIMAAGEAKYIRLWDAEREMRICDIPSGSDTAVLKLSCAPNGIFAAGFYDGSVRIFDRRCPPAETRCATIREHINPVLAICLRDDCESLVTADVSASVRLYDIRKAYSSVQNWSAGTDVSAMAIHTSADILACATSQIVIYGLDGVVLSSGRSNEGFMAPRKGVASCLSFHKYKLNLAAGYNDNTAAVLVP